MGAAQWRRRVVMAIMTSIIAVPPSLAQACEGCIAAFDSPFPRLYNIQADKVESYDCQPVPFPVIALDAQSKYDAKSENKDQLDAAAEAAFKAEMASLREYQRMLMRAANTSRFDAEKSEAAVNCTTQYLLYWVKADALSKMESHTANQHRSIYVASMALAWLQIRDRNVQLSHHREIEEWLFRRSKEIIAYFEGRKDKVSGRNNHRYWAGLAVSLTGLVAQRCEMMAWGRETLDLALGQVTEDGYLPLELARGSRALEYHLYALAPLMMLAKIEKDHRHNPMSYRDGALKRLVSQTLGSLQDPTQIIEDAQSPQVKFKGENGMPRPHELAWIELLREVDPELLSQFDLELPQELAFTSIGGNLTKMFRSSEGTK